MTLFTAFGIAIVKAYLVAVRFMHLDLTPRFVIYFVATSLVFMLLFFAGTAPDVFAGCCSFFPIWAQKGFTLDLRPFVAADVDQATIDDWDRPRHH